MNIQQLGKVYNGLLQIGIIVIMLGLLLSCVPGQTQDFGSLAPSPASNLVEREDALATPTALLPVTESTDISLFLTFTPSPTLGSDPLPPTPSATSTQISASIPISESIPFDFQGKIVFSVASGRDANESALWLLPPSETKPQLLHQEEGIGLAQPLISPTGRYLAYIRYAEDIASIWVMDMETKETSQWSGNFPIKYVDLQDHREAWNGIILQSWSPDEQALVFQAWERDVLLNEPIWSYVLSANGDTKQLGSRIYDISWSPINPNELVFISGLEGVYQSNVTETLSPTLILATPELYAGSLAWHPDGQHLAVAAGLTNETPLWVVDLDTIEVIKLAEGVPGSQLVRWSPDGTSLFWKLQDSNKLLQFQDDTFDLFTIQALPALNPYLNLTSEQIWMPDSIHLGLLQGSPTTSKEVNLCFYTISGEKIDCPASSGIILNQLGMDQSIAQVALTWIP